MRADAICAVLGIELRLGVGAASQAGDTESPRQYAVTLSADQYERLMEIVRSMLELRAEIATSVARASTSAAKEPE